MRDVLKIKKLNPYEGSNPMTWDDAAKIAAVLALANFFIYFLIGYSWPAIQGNYGTFLFDAFKFLGAAFFANFLALTGLTAYQKRIEEKKSSTPD